MHHGCPLVAVPANGSNCLVPHSATAHSTEPRGGPLGGEAGVVSVWLETGLSGDYGNPPEAQGLLPTW